MKKIHLLLFVTLLGIMVSCKSKQKSADTTSSSITKFNEQTFDPHFKGLGTEPFWNIELDNNFVVYQDIDGNREAFPIERIDQAQDANVQLILSENATYKIQVTISQQDCSDGMSDNNFSYKTKVELTDATGEILELNGCGNFIVPKKLQATWELNSFNGNEIPANKYLKTPFIQFENEETYMSGNASCNGIKGGIFIQNETIRFANIASTRMMCVHENMETEFLKELPSITNYKIIDNKLHLFSGDQLKMKFSKKK